MHVLHTFANNDHVPYLTWFAQRAHEEGQPTYSFVILYPKRPSMMAEMEALGYPCTWIQFDDAHRKRDMLRALPKLWRIIRERRPDIVHCNLFDDSLPGLLAAWAARVPKRVVTKQDTGYHFLHAPKWMMVDRFITRLATDVITISSESAKFLMEKEHAPESKLRLVHNGIPPAIFTAQDPLVKERLLERFGILPQDLVIGTVARFIEWKGYRHIVEAAKLIVERHPNARFLFCGKGEQEAEIRELVAAAGLDDHVVFTGWVERKDMASLYGILDIYLHAALLEPYGLVFPEAMMNGVPVVSTATGAAKDAIEMDVNGILVSERTGAALAKGVERLMQLDRRAIGMSGKDTAMRMFTFDSMWHGTMAVYNRKG